MPMLYDLQDFGIFFYLAALVGYGGHLKQIIDTNSLKSIFGYITLIAISCTVAVLLARLALTLLWTRVENPPHLGRKVFFAQVD
jgi:hypothetical protein